MSPSYLLMCSSVADSAWARVSARMVPIWIDRRGVADSIRRTRRHRSLHVHRHGTMMGRSLLLPLGVTW